MNELDQHMRTLLDRIIRPGTHDVQADEQKANIEKLQKSIEPELATIEGKA